METSDFFGLVLPTTGLRCVATPSQRGFKHRFFEANDRAAEATLALDATSPAVYFGCASYLSNHNRTGENVAKVRSFWLDVDCGPTKPYATQQAGLLALASFKKKLRLPVPWIVSSGYGLHVYWPMDADLTPEEWRPLAVALKAATMDLKFQVDHSRTADIATVLRAIGTHNRKSGVCDVRLIKAGAQSPGLPLT